MQQTVIHVIVSGSLSIILNWRVEGKGRTVCRSLGQSSVSLIRISKQSSVTLKQQINLPPTKVAMQRFRYDSLHYWTIRMTDSVFN
jgi:hypothetical protein